MSPSNPPPPQPTDAGFFSVINFCTRLKEAAHLILHPQEKTPLNYPPSEAHSIFTGKSDDISESRGVHTHTHTHTQYFPREPRISYATRHSYVAMVHVFWRDVQNIICPMGFSPLADISVAAKWPQDLRNTGHAHIRRTYIR